VRLLLFWMNGFRVILIYNILLFMVAALGLPLILPVLLASGKLRRTFTKRLGFQHMPDAAGSPELRRSIKGPIWIHALSVGEVLSAVPLVKALKHKNKNYNIYFSVSTRTGFRVANRELTGIAGTIFFYPYDLFFVVRRVVNKVNPALVIIVETDIWPNFLNATARRNVPVVLVNARLSKKSFRGYKRFAFFFRRVFSGFSKICVQSDPDGERFRRLGISADRITVTGNIKFDQDEDPIPIEQLQQWRRRLKIDQGEKVWLAGSTHAGEEAIIRDVFIRLQRKPYRVLLILAPRDPQRAPAVARLFQQGGISTALVSGLSSHDGERVDGVIVDTIGDLRMLYALADMAFIGGSLVTCGGHNPLEPAAFSKPVLFGGDMSDFAAIARMLLESGGARQVRNAADLYAAVSMLMGNRLKAEEMGQNAYRVFCENKGALARNLEIIVNELSDK